MFCAISLLEIKHTLKTTYSSVTPTVLFSLFDFSTFLNTKNFALSIEKHFKSINKHANLNLLIFKYETIKELHSKLSH